QPTPEQESQSFASWLLRSRVSAGQPSLAPDDITIAPRFGVLLQNPATIRISIQHPSLPRLEFKSGDFKPGLIAPSSLSTTRLAGQRAKATRPSPLPRAQAYADCRHPHRLNPPCLAPPRSSSPARRPAPRD